MHGWLFEDINFVWSETLSMLANDLLKLNDAINTFLLNLNIILYQYLFLIDLNILLYQMFFVKYLRISKISLVSIIL